MGSAGFGCCVVVDSGSVIFEVLLLDGGAEAETNGVTATVCGCFLLEILKSLRLLVLYTIELANGLIIPTVIPEWS